MPNALGTLDDQRTPLLRQTAQLGDFRTAFITGTRGRSDKPEGQCARPQDPRLPLRIPEGVIDRNSGCWTLG
jgi:hypothetical protein